MATRSKVRQLPPEIREQLDRLLNEGVTLNDIMEKLRELGVAGISRSGLGRYKQTLDKVGEKLRRTREISNAFIERLGSAPEGKQGRLLVEVMQTVIFDLLLAAGDGEIGEGDGEARQVTLDPMGVMLVARALKDLASAQKAETDVVVKVRQQLAREAEEKIKGMESHAAQSGAAASGFDPETLRRVREEIYGIPSTGAAA